MQGLLSQLHLAAASLEFEKESLLAEVLSLRAEVSYLRAQIDVRDRAAAFLGLPHVPHVSAAGRQDLGEGKSSSDAPPNPAANGRVASADRGNPVSTAVAMRSHQHGLTNVSKAVASASSKDDSATFALSPFAPISGSPVGTAASSSASGLGSSAFTTLNNSSSALAGPPTFSSSFPSIFGAAAVSKNSVPATGTHLVSACPASSASLFLPPNPFGRSASRAGFTSSAATTLGHRSESAFGSLVPSTFGGGFAADSASCVASEAGLFSSSGLFMQGASNLGIFGASNLGIFGAQTGSVLAAGTKSIFEPTLKPECDATAASVNALFRVPPHDISAYIPTTLNTTHVLIADEHSRPPGQFVAITMMHQFKDYSLEELRLADYTDGIAV